jgi:hypothetical protein
MSQPASAARSPAPRSPLPRHAWRALLVVILGTVTSQYLAAFIFLWSTHLDIRGATPLTVARYAHYHGDRPDIRRQLLA